VVTDGNAAPALPVTIDWYRQAANWLVGLSTGALAVGLTLADRVQAQSVTVQRLFLASGLAFLIAVVAGVRFYLWVTTYANQREQRDAAKDDAGKVVPEQRMAKSLRRAAVTYQALLWSFTIGVGFAAVDILVLVTREHPTPGHWTVVSSPVPLVGCATRPGTFLLNGDTSSVYLLERSDSGTFAWQRIPFADGSRRYTFGSDTACQTQRPLACHRSRAASPAPR
jgi:hypothetical protein